MLHVVDDRRDIRREHRIRRARRPARRRGLGAQFCPLSLLIAGLRNSSDLSAAIRRRAPVPPAESRLAHARRPIAFARIIHAHPPVESPRRHARLRERDFLARFDSAAPAAQGPSAPDPTSVCTSAGSAATTRKPPAAIVVPAGKVNRHAVRQPPTRSRFDLAPSDCGVR